MYKLHIRIIEAKDCPKFDNCNSSDPYVIIKVNGQEQKTKVISNTCNPVWNQEFHFDIENPTNGVIEFIMKDSDGKCQGKDDDMCTLNLSFSTFTTGQVIDNWYDMIACKKKKGAAKIHMTVNIGLASTPAFTQSNATQQQQQQGGYPQQQGGFPQQQGGFPPQQGGFPQQGGHPPHGGFPPQGGFPPR